MPAWWGGKERGRPRSARVSLRCASVTRPGRISCSTTGTPAHASCQAASEPARPPPTMCTALPLDVIPPDHAHVVLSAAKDLIATCYAHEILRYAQEDKSESSK